MLKDLSPVSHTYTCPRDLERPPRCPSKCWMHRVMSEWLANALKARICGLWAVTLGRRKKRSITTPLPEVRVRVKLTSVKYICGPRGQSVDHSDEQPAGQNHRDWFQQGETDGLTGELQRLHGPGNNSKNWGFKAAYFGKSCLVFFLIFLSCCCF